VLRLRAKKPPFAGKARAFWPKIVGGTLKNEGVVTLSSAKRAISRSYPGFSFRP
jgi:hypothetical protein